MTVSHFWMINQQNRVRSSFYSSLLTLCFAEKSIFEFVSWKKITIQQPKRKINGPKNRRTWKIFLVADGLGGRWELFARVAASPNLLLLNFVNSTILLLPNSPHVSATALITVVRRSSSLTGLMNFRHFWHLIFTMQGLAPAGLQPVKSKFDQLTEVWEKKTFSTVFNYIGTTERFFSTGFSQSIRMPFSYFAPSDV